MKAHIHSRFPGGAEHSAWVQGPEFGDGGLVACTVIGISCYPGEQVTFWIRGSVGKWLYAYVPAHYLALHPTATTTGAEMLAAGGIRPEPPITGHTPLVPRASSGYVVDTPIVDMVKVAGFEYQALATIDFMEQNELLWVLARKGSGAMLVSTHRKFDAAPLDGGLRKMRQTWT